MQVPLDDAINVAGSQIVKLSSPHFCLLFVRRRQRHGGPVLRVSVLVADGAGGRGGTAGELCELLQGEGDQLQGDTLRKRCVRPARMSCGMIVQKCPLG